VKPIYLRVPYNILEEKIQNRAMIETEFGKRMWEEYKKVLNEAEKATI